MGMKFDDAVLVVLATAPAGLGHIRVTEALRQGLSAKTRVATIGISDPGLQWIHRLTSQNKLLKRVMEFSQENRLAEAVFSANYRKWLRTHTTDTEQKLINLVSTAWPQPETVLVVATHFGLAHELVAAKKRLVRKLGVKIKVAVVVTDDSPQEMWAVSGADVIFVPSNTTRELLLQHLLNQDSKIVPEVITVPYPVSVLMGESLSEEEYAERLKQVRGHNLRVLIPISGAAVQLEYFQELIGSLVSKKIGVTVVSRESAYTQNFLTWCREQERVDTVAHIHDQDVVFAYEQEYMLSVYGIEVTKPSEQAFKALYTPKQRGGTILLFSAPVGRQEKDNLAFLRRHRLIPSVDDQARLNEWGLYGNGLHLTPALFERAKHWRGIMLPGNGAQAGVFIERLIESKILAAMVKFGGFIERHDEVNSSGVKEVWDNLAQQMGLLH